MLDTSGSPTRFSRLGMPPFADTVMGPLGAIRSSRVCRDGETAAIRSAKSGALRTLDVTNRALDTDPNELYTRRSPLPLRAGSCACSRITSPTPSNSAITATPKPNPAASTAARTGRVINERHATLSIIRRLLHRPAFHHQPP